MMRIAITGSTGFVGGSLVRYFAKRNFRVIAYGRRRTPPQSLLNFAEYRQADIRHECADIDADVCVHVAALANDQSAEVELWRCNVLGTRHVVEAARHCRCFVYISSSSVYPPGLHPCSEKDVPSDLEVLSPYGRTKLQGEHELADSARPVGQIRVILRPRAIYGNGDRVLLPRLLRLLRFNRIIAPGDLKVKTSVTHVFNLADAVENLIGTELSPGIHTYNVSDLHSHLIRDLVGDLVTHITRARPRFVRLPLGGLRVIARTLQRLRYGGTLTPFLIDSISRDIELDISKLKRESGYEPAYTFDGACPGVADWVNRFGGISKYLAACERAPWMHMEPDESS